MSPILFLFFTAPLLDRLEESYHRFSFSKLDTISLAYVDDTYLIVSSPTYVRNCKLLEELHAIIMDWAKECGVIFEPTKYGVMHFRISRLRRSQQPRLLPTIDGLTEESLKEEMRILGVFVDSRLTWRTHVDHVSTQTLTFARYSLTSPDHSKS